MVTDSERPLRADAARNVERILRTARTVFAGLGPDAQLDEIARRADVSTRTLYNHFPNKADLVRAALDQAITEDLAPAADQALADDDPLHGLRHLIEAAMSLAARELNTLAAARAAGTLTSEVYTPFYESLTTLAQRAQDAGLLRADLVPDDLPRLMAMLTSTLWTMDPGADGWRRYLGLVLDGLAPAAANPLHPPVTLLKGARTGDWSL
ncbi:AcrR family transcriptional regulator [Kibdelosporangium banguiense]|uniref:AcrR family transcriptional regulator n=1 Tax=Kibdelosporangium banguiense TaxID=1365924 RepID=A0ABS4T8Z9_9PSEU|nr:TetR/AcrR family transcriptional regulator [Kibdelosporangium banguiense]MBP2320409.1 AcrR family transcriptional regulator [Kibdelosporangium banguiense]